MRSVPLSEFMPYGAPELLGSARRHMSQALIVGSALCTLAFVLVGVGLTLHVAGSPPAVIRMPDCRPPVMPRFRIEDILPLKPRVPVPHTQPPPNAKVIPVKPKDAEPDATTQVSTPVDLPSTLPGGASSAGKNPGTTGAPPVVIPDDNPVDIYLVEQMPVALHEVKPEYPDLAREAQVSGLVLTRILVGSDGRVRDVQLDHDRNVPMLNQAAIDAARQWIFRPAMMNGHPVAVWTHLPFRFTLQ